MNKRRRLPLVVLLAGALGVTGLVPDGEAAYAPHDRVVSADPADNTPHVKDGKVLAILPMGNRVYVGGTFTEIKNDGSGTVIAQHGLFALDPATMKIDEAFKPVLTVDPAANKGVQSLAAAPGGNALFVGGDFNGSKLRKLDATNGAEVPGFSGGISSAVKDIAVHGDRLYAGGIFDDVREGTTSVPRGGLAALNVDSGDLLDEVDIPFTVARPTYGDPNDPVDHDDNPLTPPVVLEPKPRVEHIALTPDGNTMVVGGNFTVADGQDRWQVALLDVTPGRDASVIDWQTDRYDDRKEGDDEPFACAEKFDTHIKDIDVSPDGSYFVVVSTGGYTSRGPLCDTAARWETGARGSGLQPTWANYDGGDSYTGVAVTGSVVYVSGHNRWLNNYFNEGSSTDGAPGRGSIEREGIAALDPASGLPLPWNPRRERGHGAEALVSVPGGLWVGSDTDFIGGGRVFGGCPPGQTGACDGERHPKLAFFPLAGGATVDSAASHGLPGDLYSLGGGGFVRRHFNGGGAMGGVVRLETSIDWSQVRGAFALGNFLYTGWSDGRLLRWTFDGSRLGQPEPVNMRGLQSTDESLYPKNEDPEDTGFATTQVGAITGMFHDRGRIYYTRAGQDAMYYRSFLHQNALGDVIVGDQEFEAGGSGDWSNVAGMTMAGGRVFWSQGGNLHAMDFRNGAPAGSASVVANGAGLDGRGMFLMPGNGGGAPPGPIDPNIPPGGGGPNIPGVPQGPARSGYWMVGSDGAVYAFGDAKYMGGATPHLGSARAVDIEPTPTGNGYWIVDNMGHVFSFGDAGYHGGVDTSRLAPDEWVTSLSSTPSARGYWIFTTRGRTLAFGDADYLGDMSRVRLNGPVLDSIPTPSGNGYYMVASDGGIFTFGDAKFWGSMGGIPLNGPVQSLVPDPDGRGYWLVATDGGVFSFEAGFKGSMGNVRLNQPMTGMVPYGDGYLMVAEDGGIFNFGPPDGFKGSLGNNPPANPVVSVAALD